MVIAGCLLLGLYREELNKAIYFFRFSPTISDYCRQFPVWFVVHRTAPFGRAFGSHPRGRRFDPVQVHQEQGKRLCRLPCFYVKSRIGTGNQVRRPLKALSGKMTKKKRGSFFCAFSVFKLNLLGRRFKTEKLGGFGGACVQSLCPAKAEKFHKTEIAFFPQLC